MPEPHIERIHKDGKRNVLQQMQDMYDDTFDDAIPFDILRSLDGDCSEVAIDAVIDGDDVYGFSYTMTSGWLSYILCLVVREDVRGMGYGTMLVSHIQDEAFESDVEAIVADIEGYDGYGDGSVQARRALFYIGCGMDDIGPSAFDDGMNCVGDRLMCINRGAKSCHEISDMVKSLFSDLFDDNGFHEIGTPLQDGYGSVGFIMAVPDFGNEEYDSVDDEGDGDMPACEETEVKFMLLDNKAKPPVRKHSDDAGADLSSTEELTLAPGESCLVPTGVAIELPENCLGYVTPRSGLAAKHGISIVNAPGLIDTGYRGEIKVCLINLGTDPFHISVGDRIAQLVVQRYEPTVFVEADAFSETGRGDGGFGSTGR